MNKRQLKTRLQHLGIPNYCYSLNGGTEILKTTLAKKDGKWIIYEIDERGNYTILERFDSEEDACDQFYLIIIKQNEIREKKYIPDPKYKKITFDVNKDGDIIVLGDGVPILKNGIPL